MSRPFCALRSHDLTVLFQEDMRKQQHLIERDIQRYMPEYEVRRLEDILRTATDIKDKQETETPDAIARLLFRLVEWYKAWSPIPE